MNARFDIHVDEARMGPVEDGYQPVTLGTNRGEVLARYYRAPGARRAVVMVGGVGGGFDSPGGGLYARLAEDLAAEGISALRVRFRHPGDMDEAVLDVLVGLSLLQAHGHEAFALIGHSFGGAVVVQAAAASSAVRTVVTIATQSYGAEAVSLLPATTSILLLHGTHDRVLPYGCSERIHAMANEPKRLQLYADAGHGLEEVAEEVYRSVHDWLLVHLGEPVR